MRTFKLTPDGFQEIRQKTLIRTIPLGLFAASVAIYLSSLTLDPDTSAVPVLPYTILVILAGLGMGLSRVLKRQKEGWESYSLSIDRETITITQNQAPPVIINKGEVKGIEESPEGHILLKGKDNAHLLGIPASIQNRKELLNSLAHFGEISKADAVTSKLARVLPLIAPLATLGLLILFFIAESKFVLIPIGVFLITGLIWSFFEIQRSKIVQVRVKKSAYFLLLVLVPIVVRLLIVFDVLEG